MNYDPSAYSDTGSSGSPVFSLLLSAVLVLANWFIFMKAGEPGWFSIIPGLNAWTLFRIVYGSGWKCLLLLVPGLNIVVYVMFCIRFAQAFGMGIICGIAMIFVSPLIMLLAAFGPFQYKGSCYNFL